MTEQMWHEQSYAPPVLLRQAREAAGLHIAALAAALKVPVKKLEALEAGRYDELPDLTFARALASSACRHLKIDPAPVLAQIPVGMQPVLGDTSATINEPFRPVTSESSALSGAAWLRRPAVLLSLALLVGAASLALVPEGTFGELKLPEWVDFDRPAVSETTSALPGTPASTEGAVTTPVTVPEVQTPAPASAPVVASTPAPAAETTPTNETKDNAPAPTSLLHIEASGESWLEVVDGAGRSQVQRVMKPGEVLDFSANPPYAVVVGRADAVTVTVRGQRFDIAPYARNSVARFQVK